MSSEANETGVDKLETVAEELEYALADAELPQHSVRQVRWLFSEIVRLRDEPDAEVIRLRAENERLRRKLANIREIVS